jgi:hypothetical protein
MNQRLEVFNQLLANHALRNTVTSFNSDPPHLMSQRNFKTIKRRSNPSEQRKNQMSPLRHSENKNNFPFAFRETMKMTGISNTLGVRGVKLS